ncbi:MAG: site-specific integrase [Candidatus Rokubacteria bacterium]|nr:site-specific integrase [Candidatus Rokubacteria bacterium]
MGSIRSERGRLFLDFRWRGVRCREWTGKPDTPANRAELKKLLRQVDGEIAAGTFDYEKHFPGGSKRHVFAPPSPPADTAATFADHARRWIETRRPWLAGGTQYDYERIIEGHLIPYFGARSVSEIRVDDVEAFVGALKRKRGTKGPILSNRRINMVLQVLRLCLDPAVRRGLLEENPARAVIKLKEERTDIDPLSLEEVKLFLAHLPGASWKRYFTVAFFTGLRPSEQIGLRWDAIDWAAKPPQVVVRRGVTRRGGVGRPKTEGSYREIPMLPVVERALREQRAESQLWSEWVFPNERGGHLDITNLRERVWKPTLRLAGLRGRALYQTRHTFATLALASGEDVGWVARVLGHTSTEMVIHHYHKFIPNLTRRDGSAVAELIARSGL